MHLECVPYLSEALPLRLGIFPLRDWNSERRSSRSRIRRSAAASLIWRRRLGLLKSRLQFEKTGGAVAHDGGSTRPASEHPSLLTGGLQSYMPIFLMRRWA